MEEEICQLAECWEINKKGFLIKKKNSLLCMWLYLWFYGSCSWRRIQARTCLLHSESEKEVGDWDFSQSQVRDWMIGGTSTMNVSFIRMTGKAQDEAWSLMFLVWRDYVLVGVVRRCIYGENNLEKRKNVGPSSWIQAEKGQREM